MRSPSASASGTAATPATRTTIDGRYRVEAEIGHGAMGTVYRVRDAAEGRTLALKTLDVHGDTGLRRARAELWFRREFHVIARLRHPCIVEAYDFGLDDGVPYYTMELLDGHDLRDAGDVGLEGGARILRDVASALAFLHARRQIHRDVKPRNVRCMSNGHAKLIDFGVLATMGTLGDVAGTPTSLAPEAVRGLPLDGRADLFSLGVLAYWMFTGQHPYLIEAVDRLEQAWRTPPQPLTSLRPDLPAALHGLVMALVDVDAARRPGSAAEVIDRLDAIAGGAPRSETDVAQGWLRSAATVGRDVELGELRDVLDGARAGEGAAIVLESGAGDGRSRLLREAAWHAQVGGLLLLRAQPEAHATEPYAVVRTLMRQLATVDPLLAERISAGRHGVLERLLRPGGSSDVWPRLEGPADPAEQRLREQRELHAYLLDVVDARPTAILVDDLEHCDEASAAALAALAHEAHRRQLALVVTINGDVQPIAHDAIASLYEVARRIALAGLDAVAVRALAVAMLGEVPGVGGLATWLHQRAGGHVTHTMELARWVVERGVVRYAEGEWVIGDLAAIGEPPDIAEAQTQRAMALAPECRALAEIVAVVGDRMPLEWCVRLAAETDDLDEGTAFAAVDQLLFAQVFVGDDREFGLCHDGLRDALVRLLTPQRARRIHAVAAELLAQRDSAGADLEVRIGRHWLGAGEDDRAAELLERAGRRLYDAHSFFDAIAPLEAALDVLRRRPGNRLRCIELQQMLTRAGVLCDRGALLRHAGATIDAMEDDSGLAVARRVARIFGGRVGLGVGLAWAGLRWLWSHRSRERPVRALVRLLAVATYTASVHSLGFAEDELRALLRRLEPLRAVRGRIPRGAYLIIENFLHIAEGRWRSLERNVDEILAIFHEDGRTPLAEIDRRLGFGAAHYMRASMRAMDQDPSYRAAVADVDEVGLQFFTVASGVAHIVFHRLRGEEHRACEQQAASDVGVVQLGNAWVFAAQLVWLAPMALGVTGDVLGLKRSIEVLERRVVDTPGLAPWLAFARGEYSRVRGDPQAAVVELRRLVDEASPTALMLAGVATAGLVDALVECGRADEALDVAERWRATAEDECLRSIGIRIACGRARAMASTGRSSEAAAVLQQALGDAEGTGSPLLVGLVHESLAVVARASGDVDAERRHDDQAALVFATTRNPILMARGRTATVMPREVEITRERRAADATVQLFDDSAVTGDPGTG